MKKILYILVYNYTIWSFLIGQENMEIFGYFETQMMGAIINNEFNQLYTNKLRVDLQSSYLENITFAANYDFITHHGKKIWNILDFLSPDVTSQVPQGAENLYMVSFNNRNFLDNAFIKIAFKHFDLLAGKQQISIGTGYVWNPMDVFNIKDLLDPTYEQPGHNAIRLDIPIGYKYTFSMLYSPEDTWKNSAKLLRLKGRISHFDYSLVAIEKYWRFHDYTQIDSVIGTFLELPERRRLLGISTAGELFGIGVWSEYAYNNMEISKDFYELVIGGDYTFDFQTYIMMEYYRNTLGKKNLQEYTLNDWMRLFYAEQKAISEDQVYTLIQHPATDFINVGIMNIYSISDNSLTIAPNLYYSLSQNVEITAYLSFNIGKEGSVYGEGQGSGGLLRARIYF